MAYDSENPYEDGPATATEAAPKQDDQEQQDGQTALLPKSFFDEGDLKVGYKCEVEIVALHDEEASVRYLGSKEDHKEEQTQKPPEQSQPATPSGGLGSDYE